MNNQRRGEQEDVASYTKAAGHKPEFIIALRSCKIFPDSSMMSAFVCVSLFVSGRAGILRWKAVAFDREENAFYRVE